MAEQKYAKYVVEGKDIPGAPKFDGKKFVDMVTGERDFPDTTHWIWAGLICGVGAGFGIGDVMKMPLPNGEAKEWKQTPHVHDVVETFVFMGTDPSKPRELGGEVEVWLGEGDEAEKFIITKSTTISIPPNVVHCPVLAKKVDRPFVFMAVLADPKGSELSGDFPYPPGFSKTL